MYGFKGGIHPSENKLAKDSSIEVLPSPDTLYFSLKQHIGSEMVPLVQKGAKVARFDKIARCEKPFVSYLHSPFDAVVKDIIDYPYMGGGKVKTIVLEKVKTQKKEDEKEGQLSSSLSKKLSLDEISKLSSDDIIRKIKEAGIVGLGGAMFPTYFKLTPNENSKPDFIIINAAECEPYITADHRLILEYPEEILKGISLIQKIFPVKAVIGIEDNKKDAAAVLQKIILSKQIENIFVKFIKTKFPQGGEKALIKTILDRRVPAGKLPLDVGCVVQNVGTCKAIYDAVYLGKPLVERVITLTGYQQEQKNYLVTIGTPVKYILDTVLVKVSPERIILGGPMMGFPQSTTDAPIIKGNNCILLQEKVLDFEEQPCINCARCIDVCPMLLMPNMIVKASKALKHDLAEEYKLFDCYECGCCSYVCPSKINHMKWFKLSKKILNARKNG